MRPNRSEPARSLTSTFPATQRRVGLPKRPCGIALLGVEEWQKNRSGHLVANCCFCTDKPRSTSRTPCLVVSEFGDCVGQQDRAVWAWDDFSYLPFVHGLTTIGLPRRPRTRANRALNASARRRAHQSCRSGES